MISPNRNNIGKILFIYQQQAAENCERQQTTTTDRKTNCLPASLSPCKTNT
jgi:hypothetical protein